LRINEFSPEFYIEYIFHDRCILMIKK